MWALVVAGDAPGALRHAEIFHQIRRDELELPPDPAVEALADRIRRGEETPAPGAKVAPQSQTTRPDPSTVPPPAETPLRESRTAPSSRLLTPSSRLVLAALLAIGLLLVWRGTHHPAVTAGPPRLAVLPFENLGDSGDATSPAV